MSIVEKLQLLVQFTAVDKILGPMKAMHRESGNLSKALKASKEALNGLNDQQKLIDSWRSTGKAIGITAQDLDKARELVKKLKLEMDATAVPTVKMQRAFAEATKEARNLAGNANRLTEKKQRLRQEMSAVGIDTKKVADHQRELKGRIDAATAAVEHQSTVVETHGKKMQRLYAATADYKKAMATRDKLAGAGTKALGVGAAINAAAAIPVIAYAKAEDSATQLKVAMLMKGGKISADFEQINALAEKLGNRLPGTTSDFQDMMTMLIRQGMPAKMLLGGLGEATAYLAVQLKMAPTAAAEFASKLQDATRTADKDMMGLLDTIQRTFYLGVDSNNMLEAFKGLGPVMDMIKKKGLEGANALAPFVVMMDQAGMRGESAGNAIRKMVSKSLDVDKIKKVTDELKRAEGINLKLDFTDGKGEFGGIEKMMRELAKLKNFTTVQRIGILKDLYGDDKETNEVLAKIIDKGMDGYRDVQAKMAAQADIQERVNLQLKTLKNLWDAASGTFTNALVAFGESISPELHATAEWLGKVAETTQRWAKENPDLAATLMHVVKWTGMAALVGGGLLVAASAIVVPIAMFSAGMTVLGLSASGAAAGIWAVLSPVLMVTAALAAGYAAGMLLNEGLNMMASRILGYKTTLGAAIVDIIEMFRNGEWSSIGMLIVRGIELGLDIASLGLYSKLKDIAAGLITSAKSVLGIKSPSTVFAEIGGYTMAGLEQGIEAARKGPLGALAAAAKQLTAAGAGILIGGAALAGDLPRIDTRPALSQAGGAAGGGGNTYIFQITGAPGQSPEDIGREVARQIQQLDAQRAARYRSRLVDSE